MNWKKLFLAALVAFIAIFIADMIIHGVILGDIYEGLTEQGIFRSEDEMSGYMWVMVLMSIVFCFFFTFIFAKGYEGKGIMEGVRFGIYIGFFYVFVGSFYSFSMFPLPYVLTWYWILAGFFEMILMGIIVALIYKPKAA